MQTITHAASGSPRVPLGRVLTALGPSLDGLALLAATLPLLVLVQLRPEAAPWAGLFLLPLAILVAMGALAPRSSRLVSRRAVAPLLWLLRVRPLPMRPVVSRGAGWLAVALCFAVAARPETAAPGLAVIAALGLSVALQNRTLLVLTLLAPLLYPFGA